MDSKTTGVVASSQASKFLYSVVLIGSPAQCFLVGAYRDVTTWTRTPWPPTAGAIFYDKDVSIVGVLKMRGYVQVFVGGGDNFLQNQLDTCALG